MQPLLISPSRFFDGSSWGMEYDCGDFDRRIVLPGDHTYCTDEVASHSRAGVGADPSLKYNLFGGEIQFVPQDSEEKLWKEVQSVLSAVLRGDLCFPGTIHVHIRVPQLLANVELLKQFAIWLHVFYPKIAPFLYKSESPTDVGPYAEWLYNCNFEVKTGVYDVAALKRMETATTPQEIAHALHNWPTEWKNEWHQETTQVKRPAVNFSHLRDLETLEFRHFVTTTDPSILWNIITFPRRLITCFLQGKDPYDLVRKTKYQDAPYKVPDYNGIDDMTSGYFTSTRNGIAMALAERKITVEDLGCPDFWIRRGFQ